MANNTQNTESIHGQTALVTGGASGMGAATCQALTEAGVNVIAVDQNASLAEKTSQQLGLSSPLTGDVSDSVFCDQCVASALDRFGRLDIVVNAAGIIHRAGACGTTDADWQRVMNVNVNGVFYMSRAAVAVMQTAGYGVIVNFGSIWGDIGAAGVLAYCASKGAVHQITRAMALDHATDGIRINAVCPGEVNTPMLAYGRDKVPDAADLAHLAESTIPMKRLAEPMEIAQIVCLNGRVW